MADPPTTRPSLLIRIRDARDAEAWQEFVKLYGPVIYGYARKRGLQDADAADLTQDALRTVAAAAGRLEYDPRRGSPEAWLLMRARTRAIDRLRSMRRRDRTFVMGTDESMAQPTGTPDHDPGTAVDRGLVQSALEQLPPAQRWVIELAFFEGLTQSEIAARLGEPLGTVKTRARLGLEQLRGVLRGERLSGT